MRWQLGRFLLFVLTTVWCAGQSSAVRAAEPVARAPESTATDVVNAAGTGDQEARDLNWHHWRGPRGDGVAPRATPPASWDTKTNIRWKVPIAGEGSATPIVWGQRVFVVSAVPTDRRAEAPAQPDEQAKTAPPANYHDFTVWCLERATGRVLWKQVATTAVPHEGRHATNTYASGSPLTDGQRLYVTFGSRGIYCYDLDGKLLWRRELPRLKTRFGWGEGSSPALYDKRLIVPCDQEENSHLLVLNSETGETVWKVDRDEPTSWATPLVVHHGNRQQVILNGTKRIRSYDLATGDVIWECGGMTVNAIPSPLADRDTVYCMSGYRGAAAVAIPLNSKGDITNSPQITWSHQSATPYVPSPVLYDNQLYFLRGNNGILSALDARKGHPVFGPDRVAGLTDVYASPVAADGKLFLVGRDGTTVVIKAGRKLEVLSTNRLDEPIDASPALVDSELFLRGAQHVYCVAEPEKPLVPGSHTRSVCNERGRKRNYHIYVPPGYDGRKPTPVVLALHGAGMNGPLMEKFTGLNEKAEAEGFIVVYPNGTGLGPLLIWDAGQFGGPPQAERRAARRPDDVQYLRQVIDDLGLVANLDQRRIYACGMSNGAMMCYRLAAEMSDRIAAIAPVAGTVALEQSNPQRPVPVLHMHGSGDRIVPYEIRPRSIPGFPTLKGVEESIRQWVELNQCAAEPLVERLPTAIDDFGVTRKTYSQGKNDSEVVLVVIDGGGHTWPGRTPMVNFLGRSVSKLSANDLIWDFFQRHPFKPGLVPTEVQPSSN
ncbi:MAG: PQQ-binding-like beta-propeller repeat protein [Planctomycetota bacterium]